MARPTITMLAGAPVLQQPWEPAHDALAHGTLLPATTTRFVLAADTGERIVFTGTFTVTGGEVTGGTVTGFKVFLGPTATLAGSGFNLSAAVLVDALKTALNDHDTNPFWELIWQRPLDQIGSRDDDVFYGNGFNGRILGMSGDDMIWGSDGNEVLKGGSGDDFISGGIGLDQLFGGAGRDSFFVSDYVSIDRVRDFVPKDDTVLLDWAEFKELGKGFVSKSEFRIGKAAVTEDQLLIYDRTTGALYFDRDGAGGNPQVQILQMAKNLALTAHDFAIFDVFIK